MKKVLYSLFSCLLLWLPTQLQATHLMGSDIQWQCLGNDTFRITITIYRDCNGVELWNDAMTIKGVNCNYNYSERPYMAPPVDVTPTCSKSCSRCSSPNCGFPYGIQKILLTRIVDLSNVNCCKFDISWEQNARNDIITTGMAGQRFYISAMMDKCKAPGNNSPVFRNAPVTITCLGQCVIYNQGVTDPEGDSLVYSFTPPLTGTNNEGSYYPPYSFDKPLYFQGFPNANLPFNSTTCEGFHLDQSNGDLKFKPTLIQVTVMAIKVEEFRKGIKIGEVRRDIQLIVLQCPPNQTPVLSGINGTSDFTAFACPDQQLCFNVYSEDNDLNDSLNMAWNDGIPGATFSIPPSTRPVGEFCWTPKESDVRSAPYFFTVKLKDDACPLVATTARAYRVFVRPLPSATYTITPGPCGNYSIEVKNPKPQNATFEWEFENYPNPYPATATKIDLMLEEGKEYPFKLKVNSDCQRIYYDTLRAEYSTLLNSHSAKICLGDTFKLNPGFPPTLDFKWIHIASGQIVSNTPGLSVSPDSTTTYLLQIIDSAGGMPCLRADTFQIVVNPTPPLSLKPIAARCISSGNLLLKPFSTPGNVIWEGAGVVNNLFYANVAGRGIHWLKAHYTSAISGCSVRDSVLITVNDLPVVTGTPDFEICITDTGKELSALPAGGQWRGIGVNIGPNETYTFEPGQTGSGTFVLAYHYADSNGCSNHHITEASVYDVPEVDFLMPGIICQDTIALALTGIPSGGVFSGTNVTDSFFKPVIPGIFQISYFYTGKGGCKDSITKPIKVNNLPEVRALITGNLKKFCISSNKVLLNGTPEGGVWTGLGVTQNFFSPASAGAGWHWLTYQYEDKANCSNADSIQVEVLSEPTIILKAPKAICAGEEILLQASTSNVEVIAWESTGSGSFTVLRQFSSSYQPSPEDIKAGFVTVSVKSADNTVCPSVTDNIKIAIYPVPEVDFVSDVRIGCSSPLQVQFTDNTAISSGTVDRYSWDFGNGNTATIKNPIIEYENPGIYPVELYVISDKNCTSHISKDQYITVKLSPLAAFEADPVMTSISFPKINFINNSTKLSNPDYHWNFGDASVPNGGSSEEINPFYAYSDTGEYIIRLIVKNNNDCIDTAFNKIYIHPDMLVYIPNVFSPNNAGPDKNEKFRPTVTGSSEYLFQIYDRWGEKLFETMDPGDGWDGRYNGELCPENALVYVLLVKDKNGKRYRYTGTVTMLR